jgi:hypothetical protein
VAEHRLAVLGGEVIAVGQRRVGALEVLPEQRPVGRGSELVRSRPFSVQGVSMVLWDSVLALAASGASLLTVGSTYIIGDLVALAFATSLFIAICATEVRS